MPILPFSMLLLISLFVSNRIFLNLLLCTRYWKEDKEAFSLSRSRETLIISTALGLNSEIDGCDIT